MEWYRTKKAPLVLGHEVTGEIAEVGAGVSGFSKGDRVVVSHHVPCNVCHYCVRGQHTVCETLHTTNFDPGGFSEYIRIPAINVERGMFLLPDHVSYEDGSFIEPIGCTIRAQRLAGFTAGETVLILGSGIAGLLHVALARAQAAGKLIATDINPFRLEAARDLGADVTLEAGANLVEQVVQANGGRKADLVIVCTGAPVAFKQAMECVDLGGRVLMIATPDRSCELPLRIADIWRNGITLLPSYGASPLDLQIAIDLLSNNRLPVKRMITHRLPLEETGAGFLLVAQAKDSIKVIIQPGE
jgi:L-iditol 2-dehydrogenase